MESWSGGQKILGPSFPHIRSSRREKAQTRKPARVELWKRGRNSNRFKVGQR
jgi:hypothetical protein